MSIKATAAKVIGAGLLAGLAAVAMPQKAEAQRFSVGVQFGAPAYGYGYGYRPHADFYAHQRWERERAAARRRAEIEEERREAWQFRHGSYGPYWR